MIRERHYRGWEWNGWMAALGLMMWLTMMAVNALIAKVMLIYSFLLVFWTATVGTAIWLSVRVWAMQRRSDEDE